MPGNDQITEREFDLQPHPRILPILGEINLAQWQCLAELTDNSLDAFIGAERAGNSVEEPQITIQLPTRADRDARVTIRDNAPGMTPAILENAAKAGWTGNDPIGNLGLFGMGFNIATARLGGLTRVWTTRVGDPEWYGLEIDFDQLMRQRHFRIPMRTRPKVDPLVHGTEVTIQRLKPDQLQWLTRTANQTKIKRQLERVYSAMLRPAGVPVALTLLVNGTRLQGRQHCVWSGPGNPPRTTRHSRFGEIEAYQTLDIRLPNRPFCNKCWHWLTAEEASCPYCESHESVVARERRVHGWLGVQRYYHGSDYGVDFLRNGRKIEVASKELFSWATDDGVELEYPIDDPRHRGRLVGEVHLDHCRVTYTKDRFERNDPAWVEMVRISRGDGPLRPDKATSLGYGANETPLFKLFQAFRRNSPKPKVAGAYASLLVVPDNDRAMEMAERFYSGESDYQTDAKWWDLVEEADRSLLVGDPPAGGGPGGADDSEATSNFWGEDENDDGVVAAGGEEEAVPHLVPEPIPSLTREYRDDRTDLRWDVRAFSVQRPHSELLEDVPWKLLRTTAGTYEFFVDVEHAVFRSATLTPLDGLLAELAYAAMDFLRGQRSATTFAGVLTRLRERYATASKLDPVMLSGDAAATLRSAARSLSRSIEEGDAEVLFEEFSPSERTYVLRRLASTTGGDAGKLISEGRFLEYAPRESFLRFFERHPELFLDGRYWNLSYSDLDLGDSQVTEEARGLVVRRLSSLLADAVWLADSDPDYLAEAERARLLRAALSLELLSVDVAEGAS